MFLLRILLVKVVFSNHHSKRMWFLRRLGLNLSKSTQKQSPFHPFPQEPWKTALPGLYINLYNLYIYTVESVMLHPWQAGGESFKGWSQASGGWKFQWFQWVKNISDYQQYKESKKSKNSYYLILFVLEMDYHMLKNHVSSIVKHGTNFHSHTAMHQVFDQPWAATKWFQHFNQQVQQAPQVHVQPFFQHAPQMQGAYRPYCRMELACK